MNTKTVKWNFMSLADKSNTNETLILTDIEFFQCYVDKIVEILSSPNDLNGEQFAYWRNRGLEVTELVQANIRLAKTLSDIDEFRRQNAASAIVPYQNAHLN